VGRIPDKIRPDSDLDGIAGFYKFSIRQKSDQKIDPAEAHDAPV
jgi:hypothetical protein